MTAQSLISLSCMLFTWMLPLEVWAQQAPQQQPERPTDQQSEQHTQEHIGSAEKETEAPEDKPLPGPRFFVLRHQEDWSYLEGEEGDYEKDSWDPLKNIDLGGDWRLDIGGSVRLRLMTETNKLYGAGGFNEDSYLLQQYLIHGNFRYKDVFRLFIEGIHATVDGRETPTLGIDENHFDIHQLFVDVRLLGENTPLLLRVGRQELNLGAQRLVSSLVWANTHRRFDGVDLIYEDERFKIDSFYLKPVPVQRAQGFDRKMDTYEADQHFFGSYASYKGWQHHGVDLYYLILLDDSPRANADGVSEHLAVHTIGSRFWGKPQPWDYELEAAVQLGEHSGDQIHAWMVASQIGYTYADWPMSPRLGLGFDWATGDDDPRDNQHNTFNQLFPLAHKYHGILDQVARQNIINPHVSLTLKPLQNVKVGLAYHHFVLDRNKDALYNAAGAAVRRDRRGNSGSAIGSEFDIVATWNIDRHQSLQFGWAHLWGAGFIDQTGPNDEADLFYFQYAYSF